MAVRLTVTADAPAMRATSELGVIAIALGLVSGVVVPAPALALAVPLAMGAALVVLAGRLRTSGGGGGDGAPTSLRAAAGALAVLVAVGLGAVRGDMARAELEPDEVGEFTGWAVVSSDPAPRHRAWRVVLELDGERFELAEYGRAAGLRVAEWEMGTRVLVAGVRRALPPERVVRLAPAHVVGTFDMEWASDVAAAPPLHRFANRVRAALDRASNHVPAPRDSLYLGLVVGDDRDQPDDMRDRFRDSGLSHLTAVSGQNVAFVIAAAGPLLRRLSAWWRWAATCALVAWFVVLTRFEPSVLRAGVMAGFGATAFVLGRRQHPLRLVALAVMALVVVDPLLVWSLGFWLSVGATVGVTCVGPWLAARLVRWGVLAAPLGFTLGAQAGVAAPLLLVFGDLPVVSVVANVLAIPVAGAVMLYGLPAGLVAAAVPPLAPVLMAPAAVGVAWVDSVALVASRLEPSGPLAIALWAVLLVVLARTMRRPRDGTSVDEVIPERARRLRLSRRW